MEWLTGTWPLWPAVGAFAFASVVIAMAGSRLAGVVDRLADRTGLGEAISGAVLLAGANSIAGMAVSVVAALGGNASLAISNSVGGIAAQTAFIVIADIVYRRINLEHAAASVINIFNSLLMMVLLAIVFAGAVAPSITLWAISPVSVVLAFAYGYGIWMSKQVKENPMWRPEETPSTKLDEPEEESFETPLSRMWIKFAVLGFIVTAAGYVVGRSGLSLIAATGLTGTVVGTLFTSVATSLPELVTSVAAVRAGALTLAVGGIVGGNTFDILFIAVSDAAYRPGSIYEAMDRADLFVLGWTMLLVGIVAAGLVRRQREGIGFEGYAVLALYVAGLVVISIR